MVDIKPFVDDMEKYHPEIRVMIPEMNTPLTL
jgi:hypothetical protein